MGYRRSPREKLTCPFQPSRKCSDCDCRKSCFFNFLSGESLDRFRAERRMGRYPAGQFIFTEGELPRGIYILCIGAARLSKSDKRGRELTLQYHSRGDLLGEVPYFAGEPYGGSAETLQDSTVCFLPRELVEYLRAREPEFSRKLLCGLGRAICKAMDRTLGFAFRSAESRLAGFLLSLKEPPLTPAAPHSGPDHRYSRREIAENLGLSPETVIRTLSSFQRMGIIRVSGQDIAVRDRNGLELIANDR